MVMPKSTILVGELIEYTKSQFGDRSNVQINDGDIIRWLNMGAIEISAKNSVIQASATTDGITGEAAYTLDFMTNVIRIEDVFYGNQKLQPMDKSTFREDLQQMVNEQGQPLYWYIWANTMRIWPVPTVVETITIDYIARPDSVHTSGEYLPIPDLYYEQLCIFVLSKAYELDEDQEKSNTQRSLFENKLLEKNDLEKSMSGAFPVIKEDIYSAYAAWDGWY